MLPPASSVTPVFGEDGLVRRRPTTTEARYDDPFYENYYWVAMLDPVELADAQNAFSETVGPGTHIESLRAVEHHGRLAWEATLRPTRRCRTSASWPATVCEDGAARDQGTRGGSAVEMPKPSDADKERFRALVPDDPRVETKPMFGNLAAFVNGNMFMGLFGADVGVKLPDDAKEALLAVDGAGPFGPRERPLGGYVTLPSAWAAKPDHARPWVGRALDHVGALPPKAKKPKK